MSYAVILPIDYTTLPDALLPLVKSHCRVLFSDDDELLKSYTAQAISYAEKVWGFRVFSVDVSWVPEPSGSARYETPTWPISTFAATSGGLDVAADYQLEMTSMVEPWWLAKIDGDVFPADILVTLTAGYADATQMDPAMLSAILRVASGLYENREPVGFTGGFVPSWINDLLSGLWVPRC